MSQLDQIKHRLSRARELLLREEIEGEDYRTIKTEASERMVSLRASTYSFVHFEVLDSRQILISDVEERRDEIVDFRVPQ